MKDEAGYLRYINGVGREKAKEAPRKAAPETRGEVKLKTEADFARELNDLEILMQKDGYEKMLRLPTTELRQKVAKEMAEVWLLRITGLAKKISSQDCPEDVRVAIAKKAVDLTTEKIYGEWQPAFVNIYQNDKILIDPKDIGLGLFYLGQFSNTTSDYLVPLLHKDSDVFVRYTNFPGQVGKSRENTTYWTHETTKVRYDFEDTRYKATAKFRDLLNLGGVKKDNDAVVSGDHIQVKHAGAEKFNVQYVDLWAERDDNQLDQAA